jgi:hypothetical protein
MKRSWPIVAILAALAIGGGLWFFNKNDSTAAPTANPSISAAPADALTKERLNEIEATINKQEPKSAKLTSQASVIVPSLRERFIELGKPIGNIQFGDDIVVKGPRASVSSTGAGGVAYNVLLVYVNDPVVNKERWLVLYTEVKQ